MGALVCAVVSALTIIVYVIDRVDFFMPYNEKYMMRAIELAKRGEGFADPNPMVGCVLVRDGAVIGEGWHARYGAYHAERDAVMRCRAKGVDVRGAEAYVTLEPCCHHGKQPPCSELLIEAGVAKVYVGIEDPNPLVAGHGIQQLRDAGIAVEVGFRQDEIRELDKHFLKLFTTRRPYVLMKAAATLDGRIATATGDARWVSCEESRQYVHRLRHAMMAIMVGIRTVEQDDPMLNCRMDGEVCQPIRIVVDSQARISPECQLVRTAREVPVVVAHTDGADKEKLALLQRLGVRTLACKAADGRVDVGNMLELLANPTDKGQAPISSILLEGGAALNASFLKAGAVDEVNLFLAPKLVGGSDAPSFVGDLGVEKMAEALQLQDIDYELIGQDILVRAKIRRQSCSQE